MINDWLQEWSFLEKGLQSHHQWKPSMRQKYSLMTQKSFKFLIFRCFINFTKMFVFDRSTIEIVEILNSCIFNSWPIMLTIFFFRTIKLPVFSEGQVPRFLLFFYSVSLPIMFILGKTIILVDIFEKPIYNFWIWKKTDQIM